MKATLLETEGRLQQAAGAAKARSGEALRSASAAKDSAAASLTETLLKKKKDLSRSSREARKKISRRAEDLKDAGLDSLQDTRDRAVVLGKEASAYLKSTAPGDMVGDVVSAARKHPLIATVAVLGIASLVGKLSTPRKVS